jgi:hypothetical protein
MGRERLDSLLGKVDTGRRLGGLLASLGFAGAFGAALSHEGLPLALVAQAALLGELAQVGLGGAGATVLGKLDAVGRITHITPFVSQTPVSPRPYAFAEDRRRPRRRWEKADFTGSLGRLTLVGEA